MPVVEGGKVIGSTQPVMFGISVKDRSPEAEAVAWDLLREFTSSENLKERVRILVEGGRGRLVYPPFLKMAGYDELYNSLPKSWREFSQRIDEYRTEPYNEGWSEVQAEITPAICQRIVEFEDINIPGLLAEMEEKATGKFEKWPEKELARHRPLAWTIFAVVFAGFLGCVYLIIRSLQSKAIDSAKRSAVTPGKGRFRFRTIYLWILPAAASIVLWRYYPLIRGSFMAFQDYKIIGEYEWVGIDNFIMLFGNKDIYMTFVRTLYYVGLTIGIGFCAPIILAIFLTEIPKGKYLFRTIFYLPAVTSGLVIMFIWMRLYDPAPSGFLNTIVIEVASWFGIQTNGLKWLQDPQLAMLCIVIPGVWAAAGAGSLIYQAALRSVPDDLYEAADVDGAGILGKIRHITIPTLKPLIIINFVGVFIGAFHAMQNIFVMTGGGPYNATRVIGIDIWFNAFLYLKFGYATAMAWVLGVMLIGFTVMQLRILSKVEFRRAQEN